MLSMYADMTPTLAPIHQPSHPPTDEATMAKNVPMTFSRPRRAASCDRAAARTSEDSRETLPRSAPACHGVSQPADDRRSIPASAPAAPVTFLDLATREFSTTNGRPDGLAGRRGNVVVFDRYADDLWFTLTNNQSGVSKIGRITTQ